jgi:hypothetical protein
MSCRLTFISDLRHAGNPSGGQYSRADVSARTREHAGYAELSAPHHDPRSGPSQRLRTLLNEQGRVMTF